MRHCKPGYWSSTKKNGGASAAYDGYGRGKAGDTRARQGKAARTSQGEQDVRLCLFVCSFPLLGPVFAQVDNALW